MRGLKARYFMLGPAHEDSLFDDVIGANKYHAGIHYHNLTMDIDRRGVWFISWISRDADLRRETYLCVYADRWLIGVYVNDHGWKIGRWNGRWLCK